jgi:hypothetical protein
VKKAVAARIFYRKKREASADPSQFLLYRRQSVKQTEYVINFMFNNPPEGIVLAADSRQTYRNNVGASRIGSDSATKIFVLIGTLA